MLLDDEDGKVPGCAARAVADAAGKVAKKAVKKAVKLAATGGAALPEDTAAADDGSADDDDCDDINQGFNTFGDAVWSMMVDATNTDVPDQMVPHYAKSRGYFAIWMPSYVLINFTLASFVLAVVYSEYQDSLKKVRAPPP
jgi:hypothetical protein